MLPEDSSEISSPRRPRLLFLAYFFPPVRSMACVRTWNIAKSLARAGWQVTVVTPDASVWRKVERAGEVEHALLREGIRFIRTRHPWRFLAPRHLRTGEERRGPIARRVAARLGALARWAARALRIAPEIGWLREAKKSCARLTPDDVDLILATGTPFGAFHLARTLSRRLGRPFVLDYRDLWSGYPHEERRRLVPAPSYREEKELLDESAAVLGVSASLLACIRERFDIGSRSRLISNGYDPEALREVPPHAFGHFALVYAGHFHPPKRVITPVFAALARLRARSAVEPEWAFHYYGGNPSHVRDQATRFGLEDRVVVHGDVSWEEAL